MPQRFRILRPSILLTSILFLLIPSRTFAQYAWIEMYFGSDICGSNESCYDNNAGWSGTIYRVSGGLYSLPVGTGGTCSGGVLVLATGLLNTEPYFYLADNNPIIGRRGLSISSQTTSITVRIQGSVQDHFAGDFWVGTDRTSGTGSFLFSSENCLTSSYTIPGSWFSTSERVQVRIGYKQLIPLLFSGFLKKVKLTFNGWVVEAPPPPTANSATNVTTSSFTANWNSSTSATGYRLDVSTSSTFSTFVTGYNNRDVGNVTSYPVTGLNANTQYYYRLRAYNSSGTSSNSNTIPVRTLTSVQQVTTDVPQVYALSQNYPNPFNPVTTIDFSIPEYSHVQLTVFNSLGTEIEVLIDDHLSPGYYRAQWVPTNIASGVYFYRLRSAQFTETKKLTLLR